MSTKTNNNNKQTYVYIRAPPVKSSSNDGTLTGTGSPCWIPAIQKSFDSSKKTVTVSVPIVKSEQDYLSCGSNNKVPLKFTEQVIQLKEYENNVLPMQNVDSNGMIEDYKDMVELPFMHEAAILYNLKVRHTKNKPYTRTGDIVFAVNPYQWYQDLYTIEKRTYYSNRLVWDSVSSKEDPRSTMEPHVYEVSALSYRGLRIGSGGNNNEVQNQSILVSGESGAGKTETVKICLNHIASVQKGSGHYDTNSSSTLDPVVQRVVESNPLLEAFGNAKTRRNDNSSRFGKYLQLQFSTVASGCKLLGSICDVYLLEKNRIIVHEQSMERNFHIFYQLIANSNKTLYWNGLQNTTNESFKYVGPTSTSSIEGMSDSDRFQHTIDALRLVNVVDDKLHALMHAMCVVLTLGNITFHGDHDTSTVTSTNEIQSLVELLGGNVTSNELITCFTSRTFKTRDESHMVPLNINQAKEAADAFAKETYERSFLWLVNAINVATRATTTASSTSNTDKYALIGLLDIFGFESFPENGFEQLCINYANEKLQQKFNQDIFANVKEEYENEGLSLEDIVYDDNTYVLDLIEGKTGLLALLNEECVRPKGSDFDYVQKVIQQNATKSKALIVNKTDRVSFGVHHYAGIVMYNGNQFLNKNLDTLPTDLEECMDKCNNIVVKSKKDSYATSTAEAPPAKQAGSALPRVKSNITAPTVWTKYKSQLTTLMTNLKQTQSRYIRCIKPNTVKKPLLMEHEPVIDQLRCAGVVAAITISRSCFPNRLPNSVVLARYANQVPRSASSTSSSSGTLEAKRTNDCKALMDVLLKSMEIMENGKLVKAYVVGKTKTYFRSGALEYLESNRSREQDYVAIVIQRAARKWLKRNYHNHDKKLKEQMEAQKMALLKAEMERLALKAKADEERRQERKKKQVRFQEEISVLETAIKIEDKYLLDSIAEVERKCTAIEVGIRTLETVHAEELEDQLRQRRAEKARQEKQLEQNNALIKQLKAENTKLRTKEAKKVDKLNQVEELVAKNSDIHGTLSSQKGNLNESFSKLDIQVGSNKDELDTVYEQNKAIKAEINTVTEQYTMTAQSRLEYQKAMVKLLHLINDHVKKRPLQEELVNAAFEAEHAWKREQAALDAEVNGASLEHYSNHGF